MKPRFVLIALLCGVLLTSCSDTGLVGTWRFGADTDSPDHPNQYWQFSENHTFVYKFTYEDGTPYTGQSGTWEIYGENDILVMTYPDGCWAFLIEELNGSRLVLQKSSHQDCLDTCPWNTIVFERQ